jgi:hypothetical protein
MNKISLISTAEWMTADERLALTSSTIKANRLARQDLTRNTPANPITHAWRALRHEAIL